MTATQVVSKTIAAVVLLNRRLIKMSKVITRSERKHLYKWVIIRPPLKGLIAFIIVRKLEIKLCAQIHAVFSVTLDTLISQKLNLRCILLKMITDFSM